MERESVRTLIKERKRGGKVQKPIHSLDLYSDFSTSTSYGRLSNTSYVRTFDTSFRGSSQSRLFSLSHCWPWCRLTRNPSIGSSCFSSLYHLNRELYTNQRSEGESYPAQRFYNGHFVWLHSGRGSTSYLSVIGDRLFVTKLFHVIC